MREKAEMICSDHRTYYYVSHRLSGSERAYREVARKLFKGIEQGKAKKVHFHMLEWLQELKAGRGYRTQILALTDQCPQCH